MAEDAEPRSISPAAPGDGAAAQPEPAGPTGFTPVARDAAAADDTALIERAETGAPEAEASVRPGGLSPKDDVSETRLSLDGEASADDSRWTVRGRATVRGRGYQATDWDHDEPPRRGCLIPFLISAVAVLLAFAVGLLVWLGSRSGGPAGPTRTTTHTVKTTAVKGQNPPRPTTRAATRSSSVVVPPLAGLPYQDAVADLPEGIQARRVDQPSAVVAAGAVIGTDPPAGVRVTWPATIDIFVSSGPATTPPATTATPTLSPVSTPSLAPAT